MSVYDGCERIKQANTIHAKDFGVCRVVHTARVARARRCS